MSRLLVAVFYLVLRCFVFDNILYLHVLLFWGILMSYLGISGISDMFLIILYISPPFALQFSSF